MLFAVCSNQKMAVVDAISGKVLATPTIGKGPDACTFDGHFAVSSNGQDGTMTFVYQVSKGVYKVANTVPTQTGARTMALDPKTHRIYLITAQFKKPEAGASPQGRPVMEPGTAVILVYAP